MIVEDPSDSTANDTWPSSTTGGRFASALPAKRHLYLQTSIASMSGSFNVVVDKMNRHDITVRLTVHGELFDIETGGIKARVNAVAFPAAQPYSLVSHGAAFITYVVHVLHPRYRSLRASIGTQPKLLAHADFSHLTSAMEQACLGTLDADAARDLMDKMLAVLLELSEPPPRLDPRVLWVLRKLDADIDFPFERMAQHLSMSASRFSHFFSEQFGLSFRSYQSWARLRKAWTMVVERPEMSIAEIAQALGYADAAHLSRSFHTSFGYTASAMRDPRVNRLLGYAPRRPKHIPPTTG